MGKIVTFYSYKGGVGRSFLLANVAATLARWGARVLCVDWDLEAPGLDAYFRPWLSPGTPESTGLVSLVERLTVSNEDPDTGFIAEFGQDIVLPDCEGSLRLLSSGVGDPSYFQRIQALDWERLYSERQLGSRLEWLRDAWSAEFDFILIDSRTGFSDTGGICTVQMPDVLIFTFAPNSQNIDGVTEAVRRIVDNRNDFPYDRERLLTIPVLTRFDQRTEYQLAQDWLRENIDRLEPFTTGWLNKEVSLRDLMDRTRIPYYSYWSFGERLPVIDEQSQSSDYISYYFQTIASLIVYDAAKTDTLIRERDSYVNQARLLIRPRKYKYDVFVSYSHVDKPLATHVIQELKRHGLSVFSDSELIQGERLNSQLLKAIDQSQNMLMLLSDNDRLYQQEHGAHFFRQTLESPNSIQRRLIPIRTNESVVLEGFLASLQSFDAVAVSQPDFLDRLADEFAESRYSVRE